MSNEVELRLKKVFKEKMEFNAEDIDNLKPEDSLQALGVNSISFIKAVVAVENEFDIEFEDEDLIFIKFKTLGDIVRVVENKINS